MDNLKPIEMIVAETKIIGQKAAAQAVAVLYEDLDD
jgi:hypothetical protein